MPAFWGIPPDGRRLALGRSSPRYPRIPVVTGGFVPRDTLQGTNPGALIGRMGRGGLEPPTTPIFGLGPLRPETCRSSGGPARLAHLAPPRPWVPPRELAHLLHRLGTCLGRQGALWPITDPQIAQLADVRTPNMASRSPRVRPLLGQLHNVDHAIGVLGEVVPQRLGVVLRVRVQPKAGAGGDQAFRRALEPAVERLHRPVEQTQ